MSETFLESAVAHLQKATETSDWAELTAEEAHALTVRLAALERVAKAARAPARTPIGDSDLISARDEWPKVAVYRTDIRRLRAALADLDGERR